MRRFSFSVLPLPALLSVVVVAAVPFVFAAPGCSSNGGAAASASDGGGEGGGPAPGLQGNPCDPDQGTLACLPVPGCFVAVCQPGADGTNTCGEIASAQACAPADSGGIFFEASIQEASTVPTCSSDLDCVSQPATDASQAVAYVCAFSAFDGCGAPGACVIPDPPHLLDGAIQTACGCEGQSVPYVTDESTSAPVTSPAPCAATSPVDAGNPPADAGHDASLDAGAPADASEDAPADG
jgi:hypothetical protein